MQAALLSFVENGIPNFADIQLVVQGFQGTYSGTLGTIFLSLGEFDRAGEQLDGARALWQQIPHSYASEKIRTELALAELLAVRHDYESSLQEIDEVLGSFDESAPEDIDKAEVMADRAFVAIGGGRWEEAWQGIQESIRLLEVQYGLMAPSVLGSKSGNAELLSRSGPPEAEPNYRQLIDTSNEARGRTHPETLLLKGNLAVHYQRLKMSHKAIDMLREVYEGQRETLGPAHRQTLFTASLFYLTDG